MDHSHHPLLSLLSSSPQFDCMGRVAPGPAPAVLPRAAPPGWTLSGVGASGLAAASTVLLLLYLTGRFLWVYNESAASAEEAPGAASTSPSSPAGNPLPVAVRRRAMLVRMGLGNPSTECAVCLSEVATPRDAGRLLPGCGHGFHEECIATWLRLNATCPLCRAAVAK